MGVIANGNSWSHVLLAAVVVKALMMCPIEARAQLAELRPPSEPFDASKPPPAPDYARRASWAAWPGTASAADTVPPGATPPRATAAVADVFFIHPTTYLENDAWNAPVDSTGATRDTLDRVVLGYQASAFNACCRIFAPRYRQATISAFLSPKQDSFKAYDLAYSDVLRAFDHYVANENRGRPFILASHSQGSLHATRLIKERIANRPDLRRKLVVAYVIGASLPDQRASTVLPVCENARQFGCLVNWNSTSSLTPLALGRGLMVTYGERRYETVGLRRWLCVNPLSWDRASRSPASANPGSLPFAGRDSPVPAVKAGVTGARCARGRLVVSIASDDRQGFQDVLTRLGSYHNLDYNLFYASLRKNAVDRLAAYRKR